MFNGDHVRRQSIGSSFEASPCIRIEKQLHKTKKAPITMTDTLETIPSEGTEGILRGGCWRIVANSSCPFPINVLSPINLKHSWKTGSPSLGGITITGSVIFRGKEYQPDRLLNGMLWNLTVGGLGEKDM
jgi:hypothetical protein